MTSPKSLLTHLARIVSVALVAWPSAFASAEDGRNVTPRELQDELARRDAIIVELLERVRSLEAGRNGEARARADGRAAGAAARASSGAEDEAGRSGSGAFEIDELLAERALERGLVQEGARLLEPGMIELASALRLSRHERRFPIVLTSGDGDVVGQAGRTYDIFERRVDLRVGLPWDAQLEIGLPYLTVEQSNETGVGGAVRTAVERTGSGAGDAVIGLSKVLAAETSWRPNLIGRLAWISGSGVDRDNAVALGGGHRGVASRLSAYWRRDPVVLLLSGGLTRYEDAAIERGDRLDLSLGVGLAVSPETALVVSLNQGLARELEQGGVELPGTDQLTSTLDLSVSMTLGRRLFLRGGTSAGLTDESPDYRVEVSLSSRFDAR